jgi:predicted RNA-binding Zn ribbon-like protein
MTASRNPLPVPQELTLLYEFANSLDLRRFVQDGAAHAASDQFATVEGLEAWMRDRALLKTDASLSRRDHQVALELRRAVRGFLQHAPSDGRAGADTALLNAAAVHFPLIVQVSDSGNIQLRPQPRGALSGLGRLLADLQVASESGDLDRLKMCASDECRWVFYDRSKPATRRWCSSALCGNRQKTRTYRARHRQQGLSAAQAD